MTRLLDAWRALEREQRMAALAAVALLVTMFFPWYGLQSFNRRSGAIYSHSISAFGDVSFVEAAIFLVAAGVVAMEIGRGEGRDFRLPGGDGSIVLLAGGWAALLIFYRVFSRPAGNGYPVGIEWGFFLAFVAAGALAYAGWRMRAAERPGHGAHTRGMRRRDDARRAPSGEGGHEPRPRREPSPRRAQADPATEPLARGERATRPLRRERAPDAHAAGDPATERLGPRPPQRGGAAPVGARERPPYPPPPAEQLSFEDPPPHEA